MEITLSSVFRKFVPKHLPPIDKKPPLIFGHLAQVNKRPLVINFSHIIRWMYANFSTKEDIAKMIEESGGGGGSIDPAKIKELIDVAVAERLKDLALTPAKMEQVVAVTNNVEKVKQIVPAAPATAPGEMTQATIEGIYNELEEIRKALSGQIQS